MTKLTLSICLFLSCYFKAKALKCSKYSRSFLNSHIYIRNGVLVSKPKKSNASLPSVFSPSQTIHSASSRPLPNISIGVYARWLHFPSFSANQSSQNALSKSTMKSRSPASLSTLLVSFTWAHCNIWHYRWLHSFHNSRFVCLFVYCFWDPTSSYFAGLSFSVPEFFILSLNFEFACFYFLPFSFSSLFLDNLSLIHPCFSLQPPKLFAFSFVLPLGAKTLLPTLVSRLAHTGPERLRSRKYVILNGLEAISVQQ